MRLSVSSSGSFSKLESFLKRDTASNLKQSMHRFGQKGVDALAASTPVESGETRAAWRYEIKKGRKVSSITWFNDHVNEEVNIAVILQYGHATGNGGWVEGRDYINPALRPIFDGFAAELWMEVTRNAER